MSPGKSIALGALGTWAIGDSETELGEKKRPAMLPWIWAFSCLDVAQIIVVCPNDDRELITFKPMAPLFVSEFDR